MEEKKKETKKKKLTVNIPRLNVRQAPSMNAKIVKVVKMNDKLEFVDNYGDWIKVKGGYVRAEYVSA